MAGGDLLDLETPASNVNQPTSPILLTQAPAPSGYPSVQSPAQPTSDLFGAATPTPAQQSQDDNWADFGDFHSAPAGPVDPVIAAAFSPVTSPTPGASLAPQSQADDPLFASPPQASSSPAVTGPAAAELFDPLSSQPKPVSPAPEQGLFSSADLDALGPGQKEEQNDPDLITFGGSNPTFDEFDPLAKAKPPPAPPAPVQVEEQKTPPPVLVEPNMEKPAPAPAPIEQGEAYPQAKAPASAAKPQAAQSSGATDLLGLGGEAVSEPVLSAVPDDVVDDGLEDMEKKMITVYHKGDKNLVGWYSDCAKADIREAVLCACDAIMDGGFVLREVKLADDGEPMEDGEGPAGKVFEFEHFGDLQNGCTYILEPAEEREDLKNITGDRWRRLRINVDPMMHVEAMQAIDRMRKGSNLLKHTRYGFPHLRQFQLSDDRKRLVWYSGAKRKEDSVVQLAEVQEIRLGQTTPVFLNYRLPMLEHLSFSLVYGPKGKKTLDLTCKDEFEFDHWVTGLKALIYNGKGKHISKEALLGHSKRFKKALDKCNCSIKLTQLPEVKEKGHVGLDDCIEIVTHTPQQLETKLNRLRERCKTISKQVSRLDHHSAAEMEVDLSFLAGQGPAYASVYGQAEDAQDEEMEIRRMYQLVDQTNSLLQQARNELIALNSINSSAGNDAESSSAAEGSGATASAKAKAKGKKKESAACKQIDQILWKAEVDLENVEDMYLRHMDNQGDTTSGLAVTMADLNTRISSIASEAEETIAQKITDMRQWFRG